MAAETRVCPPSTVPNTMWGDTRYVSVEKGTRFSGLGTHHARSFTRVDLAHHALRHLPGLERIVETEAADVAVRADAFDAREILDLRHLHALSSLGHLLSR